MAISSRRCEVEATDREPATGCGKILTDLSQFTLFKRGVLCVDCVKKIEETSGRVIEATLERLRAPHLSPP